MLKKVCILLSLLCLFLLGVIAVMKINEPSPSPPTIEEWLYLKSPDGKYAIRVISSMTGGFLIPNHHVDYTLDIYCKDIEGQKIEITAEEQLNSYSDYYFSTKTGPIKHGLRDENYEIEWFDGGALIKFKDKRRTLSFVIDLEEFFKERKE